MKFRKTQIKRGKPDAGYFHYAFDCDGRMMIGVPVIVEFVERGEVIFTVGVGGDRWSTLADAKREAKRVSGH